MVQFAEKMRSNARKHKRFSENCEWHIDLINYLENEEMKIWF
ncbi:hypothetical protein T08_3444 [Trichinella sp. T8]|nr:hypothetical protein T08_3444 [Trichinella sp. T8]